MNDERTLLAGTAANVLGLCVGVAAALGTQILLGRAFVPGAFGVVTVAVQVAFVASAGSRFGMDMAAVRLVAIGRGAAAATHLRSLVDRCALVGLAASIVLAAALAASAPLFGDYARPIALAALGIPFIALTSVYLGATRGLAQMRQTLYVFWIGQPVLWIAVAGAAIAAGGEQDAVVLAYDVSWLVASVAAWALWRSEARPFSARRATNDEVRAALRYGLPRAPAALLAQAMFWVDVWVLAAFEAGTDLGRLLGRCPHLAGAAPVPHVAQPRFLAVRRRPARAGAARAARPALQAQHALGGRGHAAAPDRPLRGGRRRAAGLLQHASRWGREPCASSSPARR